jgi:glutamate dehydrogenase
MITEASRTWDDDFANSATSAGNDAELNASYAAAFPDSYKHDFTPARAVDDIRRIDSGIHYHVYRADDADSGHWRFALYLDTGSVSLSRVLPVLQSLGVEVIDSQPYRIENLAGRDIWMYDFGIVVRADILTAAVDNDLDSTLHEARYVLGYTDLQARFVETFEAIWTGHAEADSFNELVLRAGLNWRQAAMLRAYAKYLRQATFPYSPAIVARVLHDQPRITRRFVDLFEALFDPSVAHDDPTRAAALESDIRAEIDAIISLDADKILRAVWSLILETLRTNYFRADADGRLTHVMAFKLQAQNIGFLPKPRPQFEVFVYSPEIEGVHLRFGKVARGGLRWSDRQEDFRTEILGLVKAQAVKNAVIVPVGAKGGFIVKRPPTPTGNAGPDREALLASGIAGYRTFISGLLDITDNLDNTTGAVVPPQQVVRRDSDDPYLVVAADKGTATFSDIANGLAIETGFWLGDAFASGGSAGYDHKGMGITAKGAWEAVKRHFSEIGIDTQVQDFTAVGIGDMSGDVFGNGMLLSEHIRLVAAFDHRHIFLDPTPDAQSGFAERKRLFALPRSSWADYDTSLISGGGGVWEKTVKAIPISAEARCALGLGDDVNELSPPELVRAILLAPVDLLWNGGIGTYIKSSSESNSDAGDKANDSVRVDGKDLRVRVIGEGGNLGATARGRIEFCQTGGKMNTDALDNSAGVDCSDHEVNIKVLLDQLASSGDLGVEARNQLLAEMTDEVAHLVLQDNVTQNRVIGVARSRSTSMLPVHQRVITDLELNKGLDRELEALPSDDEIERRIAAGAGLTSPELATLMAQVKLELKDEVLASDVPDAHEFVDILPQYFPNQLHERFDGQIRVHPLRREIVTTMIVNDVIDNAGITFVYRIVEETGAAPSDAVRAFQAAVEIFGLRDLWQRIRETPAPTEHLDRLEIETRRTLDRAARWLLTNRPQPISVSAEIARYTPAVAELTPAVIDWVPQGRRTELDARAKVTAAHGVPFDLALEVHGLLESHPLLDVCDLAEISDRSSAEIGELWFGIDDFLRVEPLLQSVSGLDRRDRWHALARLALRDDVYRSARSLCLDVIAAAPGSDSTTTAMIESWAATNQSRLARGRAALHDIFSAPSQDLAQLSVAAQQLRSLVSNL